MKNKLAKKKSNNMNQLKNILFRKSKPGFPNVQMKSQRQYDCSKINVHNRDYLHVGG